MNFLIFSCSELPPSPDIALKIHKMLQIVFTLFELGCFGNALCSHPSPLSDLALHAKFEFCCLKSFDSATVQENIREVLVFL